MASVQYGALITALKGNVGGSTFQNGNIAKVLRNKGYRAGKSSTIRQTVVGRLISQTTRWRSLTDVERAAWASASGDWPFTDKYGNTYYGSGYQMFSAYNIALVSMGEAVVDTPVAAPTVEPVVPADPDFTANTEVVWNIDNTTTASQIVQCYASAPMSQGKSGGNVPYKYIGSFDSSSADQLVDTTVYPSLFGWAPVGSLVMMKMVVRDIAFPRAFQTIVQRNIVHA